MRYSLFVASFLLACGPAVRSDSASDGATESSADDSTSAEASTGDDVQCQGSGCVLWSHALADGFAVALTSRDGAAVAAVQQFQGSDPAVALAGFDAEGVSLGTYVDPGGMSAPDFARNAIELLPEGLVALAYPVSDGTNVVRHFGVLDLESGAVAGYVSETPWTKTFGVATDAEATVVLRSDRDGELVGDGFGVDATHLWTEKQYFGSTEDAPLAEGAMLRRSDRGGVAITASDERLARWAISPYMDNGTDFGPVPEGARPVAFSDGVRAWIWTGEVLLRTDEAVRVAQSLPRSFDGELLWADAYGLVVAAGRDLVLYDEAGELQLTLALPPHPDTGEVLQPRFVRPNPNDVGLFILADQGQDGADGPVALHYVVR